MVQKNRDYIACQVGHRLRKARILSGYKTIAEFSSAHDIPRSTYNQYEIGDRMLCVDLAIKFSDIFKTNLTWLLTGKGSLNVTDEEIVALSKQNEENSSLKSLNEKQFLSVIRQSKNSTIKNIRNFQNLENLDFDFLKEVIKRSYDLLKNINKNIDPIELSELVVMLYVDIMNRSKNNDNLFDILKTISLKFENKMKKIKRAGNY